MKVITVYARLYAKAFAEALEAIRKNAWTLLWPMGFVLAVGILAMVTGPLGIIGGFIRYLATCALLSGYLYFLGELVAKSRVSTAELKRSLGAYFSAVLSVGFVLWIVLGLLLPLVLRGVPNGGTIFLIVQLLSVVLLSAAPEVIYQRHPAGGVATIQSSVQFLQENWLEWIVPNVPVFLAGYLLLFWTGGLALPVQLVVLALAGALLHVAFVFRGFTFKALDRSSHRQRMFNYRNP